MFFNRVYWKCHLIILKKNMNKIKLKLILFFVLLSPLAFFLVSCATPPISTVNYSPTGKGPHQSNNGVETHAEIIDQAMFKALFGRDNLGPDIQAVYVQVVNNTEDKLYIVGPRNFHLSSGQHFITDLNKDAGQDASATGTLGFLVTPLPIAVPLIITGLGSQAENSVLVNNLTRRELKTTTLQPNEAVSGILFFKVPLEMLKTTSRLEAVINQAATEEKLSFHLDFSTK